jgi:hypothetical protein
MGGSPHVSAAVAQGAPTVSFHCRRDALHRRAGALSAAVRSHCFEAIGSGSDFRPVLCRSD